MHINKRLLIFSLLLLLQACVAVNPPKSKNVRASEVNVELGIGYLQQNNLELANEKLLKALRQNPNSVKGNYVYAILQDKLQQIEVAGYHYQKATELDPKNSEAANNYGIFLCRNDRELESEKYFLRALDNPLYKTPEFAYANAAVCLAKINQKSVAKKYLRKALAAKSDFAVALYTLADMLYQEADYENTKIYLDRFHLVSKPTARSLWLAIRNQLELNNESSVEELGQRLETDFPDSKEYKSWLKIQ